jgi:hypothetical protein
MVQVSSLCGSASTCFYIYFVDHMGADKACCAGDEDEGRAWHGGGMLCMRPAP